MSTDPAPSSSVDTTPLLHSAGYFAFDFLGGTPIENNTVTISDFTSDATLGAMTPTGGATGTITPGPGTLDDSQFFNELLQAAAAFGTTASFTLSLTTNAGSGGIPDTFAFYLLDPTQVPITTSDPTGADALFTINITGTDLMPAVYTSTFAGATVTLANTVPEPGTLGISVLAVAVLSWLRRFAAGRHAVNYFG